MWEAIKEKISLASVRREIVKSVYGNRQTFMARLDPRVLLAWYLIFAIVPWFVYDRIALIGILLLVGIVALAARVNGFILFMLAFGVFSDLLGWGIIALLFGGDLTVFWSLSTLLLKLIIVSLASIAVFAALDPDRFADALLSIGMPQQFAFGVSYGYRVIPILLEEYHNIINAYRLRSKEPDHPGLLRLRQLAYILKIVVRAFYPMILNTAKRIRTTVESLEIRGYSYALAHPDAKRLRLAYLRVRPADMLFLLGSLFLLVSALVLGPRISG
ncbi:energy-coupling factor transporter transmembrane component T [Chloroflexus sp.]|uniref:energy-coupling factor transporter transmembrane component T family protein n=1 Tax=Chloroflexus sp. TaxID=1904827 RepID=UPI002ACE8361|nr:energy-coupling factor transporter transmembrane component T [Chloroflexus sp.]